MIIPVKYQYSNENDQENTNRIKEITNIYYDRIKMFAFNKNQAKNNNDKFYFRKTLIKWFFNLTLNERIKICTINNKWLVQTLHQLFIEQKQKANLKFIPRINESKIPFMYNLPNSTVFRNNVGHFLNYYAICSENYDLINGYDEKIENEFLLEINFFYPDFTKISKHNGDLLYILKNHYPVFSLNEEILNNQKKFILYLEKISANNYFIQPLEVVNSSKQREDSFETINNNPLNPLNKTNINIDNNINIKNQQIIDLPNWAKQPPNSKLCFSICEIFLSFFEQNIIVYYIIYTYNKKYYDDLINNNTNDLIGEFLLLKKELKDYLCINKENLFDLLNIETITKEIYYDPIIEKIVQNKKNGNNIISKVKFWIENVSLDELFYNIKEYFNGFNNDIDSMNRLINDLCFYNIEQIYTYEDFFLENILRALNKKYEDSKTEDLIFDLTNNISNNTSKKKRNKKKNKKKKQEQMIEQKNKEECKNDIKTNSLKTEDNKIEESRKENNINIDKKKFITIEEDEELSKIKKGYTKLNTYEENLCESSGSENNCDSKPLLITNNNIGNIQEIMKNKENKYNNNNQNNIENKEIENKEKNIDLGNKLNNSTEKNSDEKKKEDEIKDDEVINNNSINEINDIDKKNEVITENSKNNENKNNNSNSNSKKKKASNFYLYPTITKTSQDKNNKKPFIMKLNEDIISYNENLNSILNYLCPIKEHIIESIKSKIKDSFFNENFDYKIEVYGSFKSKLDIVCSDIDMVFIPNKPKKINSSDLILKLSNHFMSLSEYYKVTPIYTASIPLIKLIIKYETYLKNNNNLSINYEKLKNSILYKNYPYKITDELSFVNIDISFPIYYNSTNKETTPFNQIDYIKKSLDVYSEAKILTKIIKRALKLADMNSSYKGGLSSYTIFLLVISYMKYIEKNGNNKHKSNVYGHIFHDLIKYFSKFDFYKQVIDIENKSNKIFLVRNKKYNSMEYKNVPIILDPVTGFNAGKSSFRIDKVQNVFELLNKELENLRNVYDNKNENKKEEDNDNLVIKLLKKVEKQFLNK